MLHRGFVQQWVEEIEQEGFVLLRHQVLARSHALCFATAPLSNRERQAEAPPEALFSKAMDLIRKGLKLDLNSPMQACELYQEGADLLSQALEAGQSDPQKADEMQRTLDMVGERVRFITRDAPTHRAHEGSCRERGRHDDKSLARRVLRLRACS